MSNNTKFQAGDIVEFDFNGTPHRGRLSEPVFADGCLRVDRDDLEFGSAGLDLSIITPDGETVGGLISNVRKVEGVEASKVIKAGTPIRYLDALPNGGSYGVLVEDIPLEGYCTPVIALGAGWEVSNLPVEDTFRRRLVVTSGLAEKVEEFAADNGSGATRGWYVTESSIEVVDSLPEGASDFAKVVYEFFHSEADVSSELEVVRKEPEEADSRGWCGEVDDWLAGTPAPDSAEEIVTDPNTGGRKGRKVAELGSLDPQALLTLARVSGMGARKYAPYNFLKGYDWSLSFNAMQRHALAFWNGEDIDPESGEPHMGHAAWHALALVSFLERGLGTDDRYKAGGE